MDIKISNNIKEQLRKSAIVKEIPGQGSQQQNMINRAVDSVVAEFTSVANDAAGRQRLYNAVNLADKVSSSHEAGVQLHSIVGDKGEKRLVSQCRAGSELTEVQAKNVLATVSTSVLAALGSELSRGSAANSAAGVATLLNSKSGITPAKTASADTTRNKHTGTKAVHPSGEAAVAASGNSGFMRFALPLLLGALILGSIKYCSDNEKSRVVAEERANLKLELAGAQEESELQTTKFASLQDEYDLAQSQIGELQGEYDSAQLQIGELQGEYDSAQSQIGQLQGDLQSSRAEVEALRDVPVDTAELQLSLANVTGERDSAIDSRIELQTQLEQSGTERDQALQQAESLKAELDDARTTIADNEESIANIDRMKAEIVEITAARDDALERNIELTTSNEKLQKQVDAVEPTITDLESQVESLTSARVELDQQLKDTTQALDSEKSGRKADVDQLTLEIGELKGQVAATEPAITDLKSQVESLTSVRTELDQQLTDTTQALDTEKSDRKLDVDQLTVEIEALKGQVAKTAPTLENLESQVASLTDEKIQLVTRLDDTTEALKEARVARDQDTDRFTAQATNLNGQLTQMLGFRNAAEASLEERDAKVAEQTETITALEEQVTSLEKINEEADQSAVLLRDRIDVLDDELKIAQEKIIDRDTQLTARTETLESTNNKLEVALGEFNDLEKGRIVLLDTQQELTQKIEALSAEKSAAMGEIESREAKISQLASELQTAVSEGDANETRIVALESSLEMERATVAELENSNGSLEQEKAELQADYAKANGDINVLDEQLTAQGQKLAQERQLIATLNEAAARLEADAQALTDETLALRDSIEQQLVQAGIEDASVQSIDGNRSVAITLGSGNLYQTGEASLTRDGGVVLAKIGNILTSYPDWRVDVEGHTDSLAIGESLRDRYPTNWELSSARASAAVRHLRNIGGVEAGSLSVRGFGDTQPIADNTNAKGREQNRRVDIVLRR